MQLEIEGAVKSMTDTPNNPNPGIDPAKAAADKPDDPAAVEPAAEAYVPGDDVIERAVKAGMSIADAKLFANAEQADRILTALEAGKAPAKTETTDTTNDEGEGFPTEEFDKAIKAMEDDKDEDGNPNYDPNILNLLKTMGGVVKDQAKQIKDLKSAGKSAAVQSAFDKSFAGLDESVRSHIDAAKKTQLKKKFDFLKSAHASAKDGVSDEEVFEEAGKLVLGDLVATADAHNKGAALEQRNSIRLARPGGQSGLRGADKPMTETDIAQALVDALTK